METFNINLMAQANVNITLRSASGGNVCVHVERNNLPVDITNAQIKFVIATPIPITKTVGDDIAITNALNGDFCISFLAADTVAISALKSMSARHQCNIQLPGEEPRDIFIGTITLHPTLITTMAP